LVDQIMRFMWKICLEWLRQFWGVSSEPLYTTSSGNIAIPPLTM